MSRLIFPWKHVGEISQGKRLASNSLRKHARGNSCGETH